MKKEFYSFEQWCIDNNHQDWLDLWDYELNDKRPSEISSGSHKKFYFKCRRGLHSSEPKKLENVINGAKGLCCNACNSFEQWCIDNNHLDWLDLWDYNLNKINPDQVSYGSGKKYYFKCKRGIHQSEQKIIHVLTRKNSNLYCNQCNSFGQYLLDEFGENGIDLYWSIKNTIDPFSIGKNSETKVFIKCINNCCHPDYLVRPSNFYHNNRCPVCSNHQIIPGINDVATTHPQYIKYFKNQEDATYISISSNKMVEFKCYDCGYEYNRSMNEAERLHFSCPMCSDGISYPEKFVSSFIHQLKNKYNFDFYTHHIFCWSKNLGDKYCNRIYDFYIKYMSDIIIEVHGEQHYNGSFHNSVGGRTLEEEQSNDAFKYNLAISNGIDKKNYIVIDARKSNKDWIKRSIMKSNLPLIFGFSENDINWGLCDEFACSNVVKIACDMWNNGISITEISKSLCKHIDTTRRYLQHGSESGWCEYTSDWNIKPIICINNNYIFASSKICSSLSDDIFNKHISRESIKAAANGKNKTAGGFMFKYISRQEFDKNKKNNTELVYC